MNVVVVLPVPERPTIRPTRFSPLDRDHLAAGVERQAAALVDELVPHPQAALLRLPEVVGVEDAGDVVLEIDGDQPLVGIALGLQVRRVDDGERRLEVLELLGGRRVVEDAAASPRCSRSPSR